MDRDVGTEEDTPKVVELAFTFERAHGERLAGAERLLRWFCQMHRGELIGFDAAFDGPRRTLHAFARVKPGRFGGADLARTTFWVARAGGRVASVSDIPAAEWEALQGTLAHCDVRAIGADGAAAPAAIAAIATAAGLPAERRSFADDRPNLTLDIGGPGWEAVRWDDAEEALFVASPLAPPLGDPIPVIFRVSGVRRVAVEWARVVAVRTAPEAAPGRPAGFALGLSNSPPELRRAIARSAPTAEYGSRASPRYAFRRPLDAYFRRCPPGGDGQASEGPAVAGWIENLSLGGAFVRTEAPPPAGTEVVLSFPLPGGGPFATRAAVAFVDVRGMGVRFLLDRRSMQDLHAALTQLSARPRRALVVDDDGLARQMVADALVERGFDVLTANDAADGLRLLTDELLTLDLLVTDQFLPGRLGEELVATIRRSGGESDLVIVVMTGSPDAAMAARLQAVGADLLLGKGLGPEIIALKIDALLEQRLTGGGTAPARGGGGDRSSAPR